ncbi:MULTISPECIES: hypothetical protein [Campylobacter]|uniref:hypothetical protein n=1 Tax=Campylobacter TaxID=194 RepID=UPI000A3592CF|nr:MULTISPECIES: hypothetical protein [unclassified Campylobacter]MBE6429880.1 hypothetical protein [Campylobacter sp.]
MRKILIFLYLDIEWGIIEAEYRKKILDGSIDDSKNIDYKRCNKYGFATFEAVNGKIMHFFDICKITDELLSVARDDELMQEICDFEVLESGYKFTGSFIDALEYIKANFKG